MTVSPHMHAWDALRRPIWMFDPVELKGVYANAAALALWGSSTLDELLSRDFSDLSPAVRARTERLRQATLSGGEVNERWTFYPNGKPTTVETTISTHLLDDGRAVLLFEAAPAEVGGDERRAVEALRHTPALITLFDPSGLPLFTNPAAFAAYGDDHARLADRFADPASGAVLLARALQGEHPTGVMMVSARAGLRHHQVDARRVLDPVSGAAGVLLNEIDVTARIEAEQAKAAAEQRAAMAEATQTYLTEMSHELRTPLNAVIGFSALLAEAPLGALHQEHAQRIHGAGCRLLDVVNAMIVRGEAPEPQAGAKALAHREADSSREGEGLRVLYVDDNDSNRALVRAVLEAQGIACATADDGALGVEAARDGGWDVILMDIQMPVMDGVEAARAIRALPGPAAETPILAVTANTLAAQIETYEAAGMNDLVAKPIDMGELLAKVLGWAEALREARQVQAA